MAKLKPIKREKLTPTELKLWNKFKAALNILEDNNYTARKLFHFIVRLYGTEPKDPISKHALELAEMQRFEALTNAFKTIHAFADASCSPDQNNSLEDLERYLIKMYKPKVLLKDRVANILKEIDKKNQYKGKDIFTFNGGKRVFVFQKKLTWGERKGGKCHKTIEAALDYLKKQGVRKPVIQIK